ncbi:MAG TPA: hypothetical protein VD902_12930 [Symbiobacteriaceae bacterium]|nr:hypothetical protein [Symbiobacteriaceae bacterium]
MSTIQQIKERLSRYPGVTCEADESQITVRSLELEGFDVSVMVRPGRYTVAFEGWHEEFTSEEDALNCVAFGLSPVCRLRVDYLGDSPVRWTVEALRQGEWHSDSTVSLLLVPFWRQRRTIYKCNRLIPPEHLRTPK